LELTNLPAAGTFGLFREQKRVPSHLKSLSALAL